MDIESRIIDIHGKVSELHADMGTLKEQSKKHSEAIYGNGKMGLNAKVILLSIAVCLLACLVGADHPWVRGLLKII